MRTQRIEYQVGEATHIGYLAEPDSHLIGPGVLVAHEGPGLDDHAKLRTRMLAEIGYTAFALDLYGGGYVAPNHEAVMARVPGLMRDRAEVRRRALPALDLLRNWPTVDDHRVGAIGYCIGGLVSLELARSGAPLVGVVTFHGALLTPDPSDAKNIKGCILACAGSDDCLIDDQQIAGFEREMSAANVDWQVLKFGGAKHGFTNHVEPKAKHDPLNFAYDSVADRRSWQAMRNLFEEVFADSRNSAAV